jgi:hypothetical protein
MSSARDEEEDDDEDNLFAPTPDPACRDRRNTLKTSGDFLDHDR